MDKKLKIRIKPDGTIEAETLGIKGAACTEYIKILEEMLDAKTVASEYTAEFYEEEQVMINQTQLSTVKQG